MSAGVDPPPMPTQPLAIQQLAPRAIKGRQRVAELSGLRKAPVGARFGHQGAAASQQGKMGSIGVRLCPCFEALEVLGYLAEPVGADRGLDRVGQPQHEQRVRFRTDR